MPASPSETNPSEHRQIDDHQTSRTPRVSVVIPTFKAGAYLVELCASLAAQTFTDFEVLILSDGCEDHEQPALRPFLADPRFRVDAWHPNRGVAAATAHLLAKVRAPFWCYPGADDLLHPEFLARRMETMERMPEIGVIFGRGVQMDEQGRDLWYHPARVISERLAIFDGQRIDATRMLSVLLQDNVVNTPSVFLRSATTLPILQDVSINWRYAQDLHYWILLAGRSIDFFYDGRVLHRYRMHVSQLSQSQAALASRLAEIRLVPLVALAQASCSSSVSAIVWRQWRDDLYALWLWRVLLLLSSRSFDWKWQSLASRARHGRNLGRLHLLVDLLRFCPRMFLLRKEEKHKIGRQVWVNGLRKIDDPIFLEPKSSLPADILSS